MSTVLEAIAAHHMLAEILRLSLVTNIAAGLTNAPLEADHVIEVAGRSAPVPADLLKRILESL